eukprot:scaffold3941_cov78-Skeletonema_dohrnii-CCMP3373.AAC.3
MGVAHCGLRNLAGRLRTHKLHVSELWLCLTPNAASAFIATHNHVTIATLVNSSWKLTLLTAECLENWQIDCSSCDNCGATCPEFSFRECEDSEPNAK